MKTSEIRKLSDEQLVHAQITAEQELAQKAFRNRSGQAEDTASLRRLRHDIARFRTIQREREIGAGAPASSLWNQYFRTFKREEVAGVTQEAPAESRGFLKGIVDKITGKE